MNVKSICKYISNADETSVDQILESAFNRRRLLFPDWDMIYFALPKNNSAERKWMLEQALEVLMRE